MIINTQTDNPYQIGADLYEMGMKKKDRRNKAFVDEIAAAIMLQEYLRSL